MEYVVSEEPQGVDFGATGLQQILQNVRTSITTIKGTVPLDRGFGIDIMDVDEPMEIAKARMAGKIIDAIAVGEPRVEVVSVEWLEDKHEGQLSPIVRIRLKEGESI